MKIAFFSPIWPVAEAQNGIVTYVDIMTQALEEAGHEAVVITPYHPRGDAENVYLAHGPSHKSANSLLSKARRRFGNPFEVANDIQAAAVADAIDKASQDGPIDFLEMEESFGWARLVQQKTDCPVFIRTHGPHFLGARAGDSESKSRIRSEGRALLSAKAVTSPSSGVLRDIIACYGEISAPQAVIPNPTVFSEKEACWRLEECDRNMLLFVGRFDARKGADVALDAFSTLAKQYPDLRLVMVGKDTGFIAPDGSTLQYASYVEKMISPELHSRIEFLGPVSPTALYQLRRRAFVCFTASRFETFGYATCEALAMGCPAVTTRTYGPPEFLEHELELIIAELEASEQLADHIAALLDNPHKAQAMAEAGMAAARRRLSPEVVVEDYVKFCRQSLCELR